MLPYILAASRFAHYLKVIMRDKIGSFMTRADIVNFLNRWISQYVLLNDNARQERQGAITAARSACRRHRVPGKPGCYTRRGVSARTSSWTS